MNTIKCGNLELEITEERKSRIEQAIKETRHQINREMKYSEDLRKHEDINRWESHIEYLASLIN